MVEEQLIVEGGIGQEKRWQQHRTNFGIEKEGWKERAKIPAARHHIVEDRAVKCMVAWSKIENGKREERHRKKAERKEEANVTCRVNE